VNHVVVADLLMRTELIANFVNQANFLQIWVAVFRVLMGRLHPLRANVSVLNAKQVQKRMIIVPNANFVLQEASLPISGNVNSVSPELCLPTSELNPASLVHVALSQI